MRNDTREESRLAELALRDPAPNGMPDEPRRRLPFAWFWPMLAGALVALVLRIVFSGGPGHRFSPMLGAFVYFVPAVCGAVTVYLAERIERRSWGDCLWAPWVATALFVTGTLAVFIEGIICAIVIASLFAVMGSVGGLAMGIVCRVTHWPKPALYGFAFVPLLTTYTLTPRDGGTDLRIDVSWRLSTRFNWYADPVLQALLGNGSENILRFYKARSEATVAAAR